MGIRTAFANANWVLASHKTILNRFVRQRAQYDGTRHSEAQSAEESPRHLEWIEILRFAQYDKIRHSEARSAEESVYHS